MLDRTVAPPFQRIESVKVVEAKHFQLSSGIPVYYLNAGSQEVLKVELFTNAGSLYESKRGSSFFTSKMLIEGTAKHSSTEIAKVIDFYGAQIDINPGLDFTGLNLYILRKHLGSLLLLLSECLNESNFPEKELEIQKSLKKDNLRLNLEKNQFLASRKIREVIFGINHPYGNSLDIEMIDLVETQDIKFFYEKMFYNSPVLILSGMVKDDDLELLDDHFKSIVLRKPYSQNIDDPTDTVSQLIIDRPQSLQSSIRIGKQSLPKNHPDYINLLVVNEILGGYFGSRLMKNIREEKGFTYGVHSNIMNLTHASIQVIGTDVKKEYTQQTLDEIFKEIVLLQKELVHDDELENVKNYMQGSFLSSITTPFSLADKFKAIHFHGLEYSYYDQYAQTIQDISAETILRVANEQLIIKDYYTVVVGGLN